jgi:carbon-monoxide dehydrogenase medium subunit/xanthine dehydrogenase FAD-binding subunit
MTLHWAYNGSSIEQVLELLEKHKGKAKIIAGGTDIIIHLREEKISPEILIDISKIEKLKKIECEENRIKIGSAVTYTQIVEDKLFRDNLYGLYKSCKMVGSPQIRNKGTIGGNVANASPAADSIPPLIALGSELKIASTRGERSVNVEDYFSNNAVYGLKENELLIGIEFDKIKENEILSFSKLGLRKALAISRITLSMLIGLDNEQRIENIRVASGSIGKYPMREIDVEKALLGRKINDDTSKLAIMALHKSMDQRLKGRSTYPYKRRAVISLMEEVIEDSKCYFKEVVMDVN